MILVIVSIAFIGMLVAMIVYMAYCNYLMKGTDRVAKTTSILQNPHWMR